MKVRVIRGKDAMNQEISRILDDMFFGPRGRVCPHTPTWTPQVDVYETPDSYLAICEVPGISPEDIEVVVDRGSVKISGCRVQPDPPGCNQVHQAEIFYGSFQRTVRLPGPVLVEQAGAACENGIVKIMLPKEPMVRAVVRIR